MLHDLGLVSSQQGVGTVVKETRLLSHYSQGFSSAQDLLQYATTTRVRVIDRAEVAVDDKLAEQLCCKAGEHWWRMRTVRREPERGQLLAYSEIHVPLAFGAVMMESNRSRQPIFALIESRFGEKIAEIQQDISALASIGDDEAHYLGVPPASPALQILRRYYGSAGRLLEVARSVHPTDVFKYSMRVQLRHGS